MNSLLYTAETLAKAYSNEDINDFPGKLTKSYSGGKSNKLLFLSCSVDTRIPIF